ncbi:hypothetical protein C8A01DRAFT_31775 [Parachaetomium inaequale]|uniref:Uncharacterized protein n=1 Tax=Parachaetomium inaequale TaxID=2588326 RepID=A0AAN6PNT3_9PEZI|nr:hypothetical protein C8A01DRAFT_31775 [Parachaetomium inaequale]
MLICVIFTQGQGRPNITRRRRVDARVVEALRSLGVSIRKRDVQIELTNLVDEATALAQRVARAPGRDVERSEFVLELQQHNRLGRLLSLDQFEQFFYDDRARQPVEDPAAHCHLAPAVDAFEAAAWFWSTPEAFLEDDQTRTAQPPRQLLTTFAAFAAGPAAGPTSVAAANDPAYVSLAAGVDAMDLDDDVAGAVGSEMEVDG